MGTALQDSNPHMADGHAYPYMPYHDISAVLHSKQPVPFEYPFPLALWALWAEVCEIALVVFAELFIRRLVHEPVELRRRRQLHLDHPAISLRG